PCSVLPGSASTPIIRLRDLRGAAGQLGLTLVEHSVQTKTDIEQLPGRVDGILHIANKTLSQHLAEAIKAVYAARVPDINYYLPAVENRCSMAAYGASHREYPGQWCDRKCASRLHRPARRALGAFRA